MTREDIEVLKQRATVYEYMVSRHVVELIAEVERLTRERDAFQQDIISNCSQLCNICIHKDAEPYEEPCCKCNEFIITSKTSHWKWSGIQEADNAGN